MRQNSTSAGRLQNVNELISSIIGAPNDLPALPIQNPNIFVHFYVGCAISNWYTGVKILPGYRTIANV